MPETVVDVGIPTRGRSPYIGAAIDSVLGQTLEDWSLTICENGVGEGAASVKPYLEDPRIHYVVNGIDLGVAGNQTKLIQTGTAPYVALLHDDDSWDPHFLARRVAFLEKHPACALVFSANVEIDESGNEIGRSRLWLPEGVHSPNQFVPMLLRHNVIGIPTVLVRRCAYEAVGPTHDERFPTVHDYEMWLRIALRFSVGYLHVWDAGYRIHDFQQTFQVKRTGEQWLRFLDHVEDLVRRELPEAQLSRRELRRKRSDALLAAGLDVLEEGRRRRALAYISQAIQVYPGSLADTRFPAALVGLTFGAFGRRILGRIRYFVHRRRIRVHLRHR